MMLLSKRLVDLTSLSLDNALGRKIRLLAILKELPACL